MFVFIIMCMHSQKQWVDLTLDVMAQWLSEKKSVLEQSYLQPVQY